VLGNGRWKLEFAKGERGAQILISRGKKRKISKQKESGEC
jgi:hypothetical protein